MTPSFKIADSETPPSTDAPPPSPNLSDGMLADFLRLQIICTINCRAADIDQALLRPGRLVGHRLFSRLDYLQASRLAESLGRKLHVEQDYFLAEIFAGPPPHECTRRQIGFAT